MGYKQVPRAEIYLLSRPLNGFLESFFARKLPKRHFKPGCCVKYLRTIKIERSRFAGSICSGSVNERIEVRCQSAVTRPRYDTTATKIHR